jgi:hypothetical protein
MEVTLATSVDIRKLVYLAELCYFGQELRKKKTDKKQNNCGNYRKIQRKNIKFISFPQKSSIF